jgi:ABC-type Mn2+/Zn2+ transport system ATPase subunit
MSVSHALIAVVWQSAGLMPEERVRLESAAVRFGRRVVLSDISVALHAAEFACVRGANAAGKTTLLRLVAGLARPTRGIRVGPRSCAYVPPAMSPPLLSVQHWLGSVQRTRSSDPFAVLADLGFDGDVRASCRSLSFGNLRKVLLADAFSRRLHLVVVDEPHVGLDHRGREGLTALVNRARLRGATLLFAVQDDENVVGVDRPFIVRDRGLHDGRDEDADAQVTLRGPARTRSELLDDAARLGYHPIELKPE